MAPGFKFSFRYFIKINSIQIILRLDLIGLKIDFKYLFK